MSHCTHEQLPFSELCSNGRLASRATKPFMPNTRFSFAHLFVRVWKSTIYCIQTVLALRVGPAAPVQHPRAANICTYEWLCMGYVDGRRRRGWWRWYGSEADRKGAVCEDWLWLGYGYGGYATAHSEEISCKRLQFHIISLKFQMQMQARDGSWETGEKQRRAWISFVFHIYGWDKNDDRRGYGMARGRTVCVLCMSMHTLVHKKSNTEGERWALRGVGGNIATSLSCRAYQMWRQLNLLYISCLGDVQETNDGFSFLSFDFCFTFFFARLSCPSSPVRAEDESEEILCQMGNGRPSFLHSGIRVCFECILECQFSWWLWR